MKAVQISQLARIKAQREERCSRGGFVRGGNFADKEFKVLLSKSLGLPFWQMSL